jgi:hypothetical protein
MTYSPCHCEINLSFLLTLDDSFMKQNYLESIVSTGSFARPAPSGASKTFDAAKLFMSLAVNEGDPTSFSLQDVEKQAFTEGADGMPLGVLSDGDNGDKGDEKSDDDEDEDDDNDKGVQAFALSSDVIEETVRNLQRECKKKLLYMMFGLDWGAVI